MIGAIVLAGGAGKRMGCGINKQYLRIGSCSVLAYALASMAQRAEAFIVVCAAGEEAQARAAICESGIAAQAVQLVTGGAERQDSVRNALAKVPESWEKVLIHDGARPFVPAAVIDAVLAATAPGVGAVPGIPVTDTIKRLDADGFILQTPPRAELCAVQTPQCFMAAEIREAHAQFAGASLTDDAALYEQWGGRVRVVAGSRMSRKLTLPEDMLLTDMMMKEWEAQRCE